MSSEHAYNNKAHGIFSKMTVLMICYVLISYFTSLHASIRI